MEAVQTGRHSEPTIANWISSLWLAIAILLPARLGICDEVAVFPLPHFREVVVVPVSIAGQNHLCVLDTGATVNFFDTALKEVLGEPLAEKSFTDAGGKESTAELFAPPVASVGGIALARNAPVACVDLKRQWGQPSISSAL